VAVVLSLCTVLSTALGGLFALRNRDRLHLVLGFTAGVLLGLVAFDLLPEVFALGGDLRFLRLHAVSFALAFGFLLLHVVERTLALHHAHEGEWSAHRHPQVGLASAVALVVHSFLDGVGIGLAFQVNTQIGLAVAFAVIAHDFADGLNTVSLMVSHGHSDVRAKVMLALDALAPAFGAVSTLFFNLPDNVLALYLAFFCGFLLYLATGDILPEAHSRHPSRLTLLCTVGGVAFIGTVVAFA
jgi:zinc transporter, ZIP family